MASNSIFIRNLHYLITVDEDRRIIENGAVAIEGDRIVAVGKSSELKQYGKADRVIDGRHRVATPGFVNCHTHVPYYLVRGLADNLTIPTWISEVVIPAQQSLSSAEARLSCLGTLVESLRQGVTTIVDTGEGQVEAVPAAVERVGIRAVIGKSVKDVPSRSALRNPGPRETALAGCVKAAQDFYDRHHGRADGRVTVWFSPSHERAASAELLGECKARADRLGVGVETHLSASVTSILRHQEIFGLPAIERFEQAGALGPNLLIIHAVWLSDREVELIRQYDVKVCHCPSSAVAGGFGAFSRGRFVDLMRQGVTVALGSDNCAHSNFLDMLRTAYLVGVNRDVREDPSLFPPESLLEMITLNGARAVLMEDEIGSIEVGKKADMVLFNTDSMDWHPLHNPVSNLIFCTTSATVDTVLVDGNLVVESGRVRTVDEKRLIARVEKVARTLPGRIGLDRRSLGWPVQ